MGAEIMRQRGRLAAARTYKGRLRALASLRSPTRAARRSRRGKINKPQLHPVLAAITVNHQASREMNKVAPRGVKGAPQGLRSCAKGDAVDPSAIARNPAKPQMAVADLRGQGKPVCGKSENRFGVS